MDQFNSWNSAPVAKIVMPFVGGIILATQLEIQILFVEYLFVCLLAGMLVFHSYSGSIKFYRFRFAFGIMLHLFLFFGGYYYAQINALKVDEPLFEKKQYFKALVTESPVEKKNHYKLIVNEIERYSEGKLLRVKGKKILWVKKNQFENERQIRYGDNLFYEAKVSAFQAPLNPHEFDYSKYLQNHGILYQSFISEKNLKVLTRNKGNYLMQKALSAREAALHSLSKLGLSQKEFSVAAALILGEKKLLENELKNSYSSAGAMHILAVSGLHVGVIFLALSFLLKPVERLRRGATIKVLFLLASLWMYCFITGVSPSVLRASFMFSFILIGNHLSKRTNIYNIVATSAMVLLLIDPYYLLEVGFQLSYLALLGIVFFQPRIYKLKEFSHYLSDKIWLITSVSIAAQLATFPLSIYYFNQFPNYFLLANILIIPLATLLLCLGFLTILLSPLVFLKDFIAWPFKKLLELLNCIVESIDQLPYSVSDNLFLSSGQTFFLLFIIILFVQLLLKFNLSRLYLIIVLFVFLVGSITWHNLLNSKTNKFVVYAVKKTSLIEFISGDKSFWMAGANTEMRLKEFDFQTKRYRIRSGVLESSNLGSFEVDNLVDSNRVHIAKRKNYFVFRGKKIAYLSSDFPLNALTDLDYAIVSGNPSEGLEQLLNGGNCKELIIDSSNSLRTANRLEEEARAIGIKCTNVLLKGAKEVLL